MAPDGVTYLPDTNVWIRLLSRRTLVSLRKKFASVPIGAIACSSIVRFELRFGESKGYWQPEVLRERDQFLSLFCPLPFDQESALRAGDIRALLESRGLRIGWYDYLLAGKAIAHGLTLVTHNISEFSRIPELYWEDWEL